MQTLQALVTELAGQGLLDRKIPLVYRYNQATRIKKVRDILNIDVPIISDWTECLNVRAPGKVLSVRMDLNSGVDNHKKFVVAGLILRGVLTGKIPREGIDTLIDGGNYNSAKAVKWYAKRFGMKGIYVMSYLFPKSVIEQLESDDFTVLRAPHLREGALEREFYEFLYAKMRDRTFSHNKFCLWHAKYGGMVGYPFGMEIAKHLPSPIDCTVSCLGAGSTLEGIQFPIQDYAERSRGQRVHMFIAEHELSPLFAQSIPVLELSRNNMPRMPVDADKYFHVPQLPHLVIGPHYDEVNPLLSSESLSKVERIVQYSESDWQMTQQYLSDRGISVGNSSAANVNVAWRLANQGHRLLTVVFEPFRKFYLHD
jgi:cysteine synthase